MASNTSFNQTGFTNANQAPDAQGVSGSIYFPSDLQNFPMWTSLSFYEYKAPGFGEQTILTDKGTIRLPLPNMLVDSQGVQYDTAAAGLIAGAALNGMSGSRGVSAAAGALGGAAVGGAAAWASSLANRVGNLGPADGRTASLADLALQQGGVAANPFLTIMFKQPEFKRYQLSWKLSPVNVNESAKIADIIQTLKYNQLPGQIGSFGGSLLTYPNIIQITVSGNQYFPLEFKPAVIEHFDINYTPSGQPSFFDTSFAPTEVEIRLSIMEIEYWLKEAYGKAGSAGVSGVINSFMNKVETVTTNMNTGEATSVVTGTGG